MDSLQYIYELIKDEYTRTYMSYIPQSEILNSYNQVVLIQSVVLEPTKNKDNAVLDIETIAVTVFCGNYNTANSTANAIRNILEEVEANQYIREIEFDNKTYLYDEEELIHKVIVSFNVHTK